MKKNLKPRHLLIWGPVAAITIGLPLYLGRPTDAAIAVIFGSMWAIAASTIHYLRELELERIELAGVEAAEQARADRLTGSYVVPRPPRIRMDAYNDDDLDNDEGEFDTDQGEQADVPGEQPTPRHDVWRVLAWLALLPSRLWASLAPSLTVLRRALVAEHDPRHAAPDDEPDREPTEPYRPRHGTPDPDETAELVPVAAIAAYPHREVDAADLPLSKQREDWRWDTVEFQKAAISFFAEEAANVGA